MDKNNKVLLGIFLAVALLVGGGLALVVDALIRVPNFSQMRSKVIVPIKLADKTWVDREMGPKTTYWVPARLISNTVFMAVIASEDTSFFSHQGIDYHELKESIKKDWEEKRWARGASTITQQVVKNVYLSREKSLWRKFKELVWAREIEKVLTKTEILTFYLNMAEWGPSLYGIGAASRHYFDVPPSDLTAKQAAFLAVLLPSPIKFHSYFVKKELTPFARGRVSKVLRVMWKMGFLEDEQYYDALREKLWGVTGELSLPKDEDVEVEEESEPGMAVDVLEEPAPAKITPGKISDPTPTLPSETSDILKEPSETQNQEPSPSELPN